MNDMRLQPNRRRWLSKRRLLWGVGGVAAGGLCILPTLLYLAYRQGGIEQEVVADLLSKSPDGSAHVDALPTWRNRLYDLLGIPKPVTDLDLRGNRISDDDLARLESLHQLESLYLDECPITDNGVREIAKVRTLRYLDLSGCDDITDMSFTYLGTMRSLEMLDITAFPPKITGRNIQSLSALPNLGTLHLVCCLEISDDAVEPLASLNHLDTLDIRGTSISEEGTKRLRRALPNTIVLADD
jgi:hypothetical protein